MAEVGHHVAELSNFLRVRAVRVFRCGLGVRQANDMERELLHRAIIAHFGDCSPKALTRGRNIGIIYH